MQFNNILIKRQFWSSSHEALCEMGSPLVACKKENLKVWETHFDAILALD
jgi:hypothetical protein